MNSQETKKRTGVDYVMEYIWKWEFEILPGKTSQDRREIFSSADWDPTCCLSGDRQDNDKMTSER